MDRPFDLLPDAVFCVDWQRMTFCDVNRAACERLGYTREELLAMGPSDLCPPEDVAALAEQLDAVAADRPATALVRTTERRKDGATVSVEWHVSRIGEAGTERWIIVARKLDLSPLSADFGLPGHDPLTGLPDRRLFQRRLKQALERMTRQDDYLFAVCFIDLDGFKAVNDRFGHLTGDRTLGEIARRLAGCVRPGDVAARYGGDEFIVLVDNLRDAPAAATVAARILDRLQAPLEIDGHPIRLAASIGVATARKKGTGPICAQHPPGPSGKLDLSPFSAAPTDSELLHRADQAMYRAKSLGGGRWAMCDG
jgi:diguanylate cyclase (GGDEF)-like protein/PAS domain S-box-containing protein